LSPGPGYYNTEKNDRNFTETSSSNGVSFTKDKKNATMYSIEK